MGPRDVLIDSSVLIQNFRDTRKDARKDARKLDTTLFEEASKSFDFICISTISIYEVECGAKMAGRHSDIAPFLHQLRILAVTEEVAKEAASIYAELRKKSRAIQNRDILIAGTARTYRFPLLTFNLSHFNHVPGITVGSSVHSLKSR